MASPASLTFTAIFPHSAASHTTPTPQATPDLGYTGEGQPFGHTPDKAPLSLSASSRATRQPRQSIRNVRQSQTQQQPVLSKAQREVQRNLAWSTATQFLSLNGTRDVPLQRHADGRRNRQVDEALRLLLIHRVDLDAHGQQVDDSGSRELLQWYLEDVKEHFAEAFTPASFPSNGEGRKGPRVWEPLEHIKDMEMLLASKDIYMTPINNHVLSIVGAVEPRAADRLERAAKDSLISILMNGIRQEDHQNSLTELALEGARVVLQLPRLQDKLESSALLSMLLRYVDCYHKLGLQNDVVELSLAAAADRVVTELILSDRFKVDWFAGQSVVSRLKVCIGHSLADFFDGILHRSHTEHSKHISAQAITVEDKQRWLDIAVLRLGRSRLHELFDYVIRWDRSQGAIMDLKEFIGMSGARAETVQSFQEQLYRRLLHAGATTVQILDTYVYSIKAFTELDPKGVLLDRIARPIRRYLKDRDDTTRIIIASLLAEADAELADPDVLSGISTQIARQMHDVIPGATHEHDSDLDWDNMDWTPDPHDAGPDYRRSRTEDVISSLLSLYNREDFINELRNILGDHLLKVSGHDLEKEIRLLEMFKAKLGEDKLQAAEVMLHDIEESKHINVSVQADKSYKTSHLRPSDDENEGEEGDLLRLPAAAPGAIELSALVLSSFFWPTLRDEQFVVPLPVARQQSGFDAGFRALKDMRRLKWLQELGTAVVELQLADRVVEVECTTFQASVIYGFNETEEEQHGAPRTVHHSVESLAELLHMDEALVSQAVAFWVSKLVLTEASIGSGNYVVLESLPTSNDAAKEAEAAAVAAAEVAQAAVRSPEDVLMENMQIYRQFITGMLKNQGKMEASRMHMMLRMVVPGGFTFSVDELRTLLRRLGTEGLVTVEGDCWAVVR